MPKSPEHKHLLPKTPRTSTPTGWLPAAQSVAYAPPHRHHHRHKHRHHRASRLNALCCGFDGRSRRRREASRYEFRDRTGLAVSIDSGDEDDWDAPVMTKKAWGDRRGPIRDRPVDDLLITMQDLFPCFSPLFDCCGCGRKRTKRMLPCKSDCQQTGGPKLETVCLDCGNVIDAKNLPRTVNLDMFDRQDPAKHAAFVNGTFNEEDSPNTMGIFDGYKEWTVLPEDPAHFTHKKVDYTPLPQFHPAPPRIFKNPPTATTRVQTDDNYGLDETGHVELPEFPDGRR
eukprot:Gregarina_sp_Poly_1__3262@NODE_1931_length_3055_cov_201_171017_g1244_i0_p2_GENE_NODE_1931_length_3055_cov_201_171017_g1244_i0NODE_1931_length_3055_cov_201_171017_g1244_i0_p2_ORF_typecomplete_len285_score29_74Chorion_2/PF03964_15/0_09_NODE_1931_length_3055_cov_201_171017_g1244_i020442898